MRTLIDGTMARGGGGFTYLVNVIPRLCDLAPHDRFKLLIRSQRLADSLPALPNLEVELLPEVGLAGRLRFTHFELPRIASRWGADVFFSPGESAPIWSPCPTMAAFRNPNVFTELEQGWTRKQQIRLDLLRMVAKVSARTCDQVMFVSQDSADWIGDSLGLPEERRTVIQHGIDPTGWRNKAERMHPFPYILSVSSIYRYKNFVRLIEAYGELLERRDDAPDLVIIGDDQDPTYADRMREVAEPLGDHVSILGEVPYADIRDWYAGAELFVFPSYLETFGHPLLEAMASDVPVVAADIPVFREVADDAAVYADPHDTLSMTNAMQAVLTSTAAQELLVKRGRERLREFTWDRSAIGLLRTLRTLRPAPARVHGPVHAIS